MCIIYYFNSFLRLLFFFIMMHDLNKAETFYLISNISVPSHILCVNCKSRTCFFFQRFIYDYNDVFNIYIARIILDYDTIIIMYVTNKSFNTT